MHTNLTCVTCNACMQFLVQSPCKKNCFGFCSLQDLFEVLQATCRHALVVGVAQRERFQAV